MNNLPENSVTQFLREGAPPPESTAVDSAPRKKCDLKDVLPASVIPLVQAAPNNETIRHLLLAHLRVPVPREEDTFEKVKQWIEFNVELPKDTPVPSAAANRQGNDIQVLIVATERERGSCSYARDRQGEDNMAITREELVEAAENTDSRSDFFSRIEEIMYDHGVSRYIPMDVVEDSETTDSHECDDTDGINVEITNTGKQALKDALRAANPELYQQLFG